MNSTTRIDRLQQLLDELTTLLIHEERRTYADPIEHLCDLLEDLRLEQTD